MVNMDTDKRIYFLTLGGSKMTDGNGRTILFFPEDARYHFNALREDGHDADIGKDTMYMKS